MVEYFDGPMHGIPSTNATKPCLPLETCVEPDVDHVASYTWYFPEWSGDISTRWVEVL